MTVHFEQPATTIRYVHVDRAVALIKAHQHFATRTPDGLLAISQGVYPFIDPEDDDTTGRGDDLLIEEMDVFHIMPGTEVVDLDAIRAWLGY